jgi:hypothetical protein
MFGIERRDVPILVVQSVLLIFPVKTAGAGMSPLFAEDAWTCVFNTKP